MMGDSSGGVPIIRLVFLGDLEAEAFVEGLSAWVFAGDVEYGDRPSQVTSLLNEVLHQAFADALSPEFFDDADVADVVHFSRRQREKALGLESASDDSGTFDESVIYEDGFEGGAGEGGDDVAAEACAGGDDGAVEHADDVVLVAEFTDGVDEGAAEEFEGVDFRVVGEDVVEGGGAGAVDERNDFLNIFGDGISEFKFHAGRLSGFVREIR